MLRIPRGVQRIGLLFGFTVFVVGTIISLRALGGMAPAWHWQVLVPLLATIPLTTHLSIRRFEALSAAVAVRPGYRTAANVVVWGAIANLLPIPGAFMARLTYLASKIGLRRSGFLNLASLATWFLAAAVLASLLCFTSYRDLAVLLALLSAIFAGLIWLFSHLSQARPTAMLKLLLVQIILTALNIARMVLIAIFLQLLLTPSAASLMALSGVAASTVGIFPAGMGLTESLAALVTRALELQFALGFAVTAINRVCGWLGLSLYMPWLARPEDSIRDE